MRRLGQPPDARTARDSRLPSSAEGLYERATEVVTMRAIVLRKTGEPEELTPDELPDPVPEGEDVLVRVHASAVCGRDLIDRRGGFPLMKLPTVLGHEFAGEVVALGPLS